MVGEAGTGKTGVLRDIAEEFGSSVVNVNLALSGELLELTAKQRSLELREIFEQVAGLLRSVEAVRAGFKKAWQECDYAVAVADKIPNNVVEEDPKLLMWYDHAVTRMGG